MHAATQARWLGLGKGHVFAGSEELCGSIDSGERGG